MKFIHVQKFKLSTILFCVGLALVCFWWSGFSDLSPAGRRMLFILVLSVGLWVFEAIPVFAVGILIIGLEIALLGRPGGVFAEDANTWEIFVRPWASPIIWLFLGGLTLAKAAEKTGLDRRLVMISLRFFGQKPAGFLLGMMTVGFVLSMFMSNTATAALMITMVMPMIRQCNRDDPFAKAILLGIAFSCNLGGMGTVIGTPPNAIAAGALRDLAPLTFAHWMLLGIPPALVLFFLTWIFLCLRFPASEAIVPFSLSHPDRGDEKGSPDKSLLLVMMVFIVTVCLWITTTWHGIPSAVVSLLPLVAFTTFRILGEEDIRGLQWDVLLLIAGGLSLGVGVTQTGLADWIVAGIPSAEVVGTTPLVLAQTYLTTLFSNLISNTAAANVFIPIGITALPDQNQLIAVSIALGASLAMVLPVSTPPNALAFATKRLRIKDFIVCGIWIGLVGPLLCVLWNLLLLG